MAEWKSGLLPFRMHCRVNWLTHRTSKSRSMTLLLHARPCSSSNSLRFRILRTLKTQRWDSKQPLCPSAQSDYTFASYINLCFYLFYTLFSIQSTVTIAVSIINDLIAANVNVIGSIHWWEWMEPITDRSECIKHINFCLTFCCLRIRIIEDI